MRKHLLLIAATGLMTLILACKDNRTQQTEIITTDYDQPEPQGPVIMESDSQSNDVAWLGHTYHVTINRTPVDSLRRVTDEDGIEYVANAIHLSVTRADSSVFLSRNYTKDAFTNWLPESYRSDALLTAIRLMEANDKGLTFAVCINHAGGAEDETEILEMTIDRDGGTAIRNNEGYDMRGNWDYGDQEE